MRKEEIEMVREFKTLYELLTMRDLVMEFYEDGGFAVVDNEGCGSVAYFKVNEVERVSSMGELVNLIRAKLK